MSAETIDWPLALYYDASCPLCRAEMKALKEHDHDDRLRLVDCSIPGFVDEAAAAKGIAVADMMRLIHARDAAGRWHVGVDVFVLAYGAIGIHSLATLWSQSWLRPFWDRLYPWVARHRQLLSRLGLVTTFYGVVRWLAGRAAARSKRCSAGRCDLA